MRGIRVWFAAAAVLTLFITAAFAVGGYDAGSDPNVFEEAEFQEAISEVDTAEDPVCGGYKEYRLTDPDFLAAIQKGASLRELISEEYVWVAFTESGKAFWLMRTSPADSWMVGSKAEPEQVGEGAGLISLAGVDRAAETWMGSLETSDELEVRCIFSPVHKTSFAYLAAGEQEALIPFGSRPDLTGLENGTVYSVDEVCGQLAEVNLDSDPWNGLQLIAVVAIIVLVAFAGGHATVRARKGSDMTDGRKIRNDDGLWSNK